MEKPQHMEAIEGENIGWNTIDSQLLLSQDVGEDIYVASCFFPWRNLC